MKFLPALEILQENVNANDVNKPKAFGIFRTKNPTNILTWDRKSRTFRTLYTDKTQEISREMLFADDWDVVLSLSPQTNGEQK